MLRIGNHRRFTANHTWQVDIGRRRLFVKANPTRSEALQEITGHGRLLPHYPVRALLGHRRIGRWTVLAYQRWTGVGHDTGLLLDEITYAERTGHHRRLDACLDSILGHYETTITATLGEMRIGDTVTKLYTDRVRPGGRLDSYYADDRPLLVLPDGSPLRPSDLARTALVVNGREHHLDFAGLVAWLRVELDPRRMTRAAITQGDPTDVNIGWTPTCGPVWFDYDTGGCNAVAGEFACFVAYQWLHGGWLVPVYNPLAFVDHPNALVGLAMNLPTVGVHHDGRYAVRIDCRHTPSSARRRVIGRYLRELVEPTARHLGIQDIAGWLRPYLVLRLLGVYNLGALRSEDAALCLALLAETLDPSTSVPTLLGLTTAYQERRR